MCPIIYRRTYTMYACAYVFLIHEIINHLPVFFATKCLPLIFYCNFTCVSRSYVCRKFIYFGEFLHMHIRYTYCFLLPRYDSMLHERAKFTLVVRKEGTSMIFTLSATITTSFIVCKCRLKNSLHLDAYFCRGTPEKEIIRMQTCVSLNREIVLLLSQHS